MRNIITILLFAISFNVLGYNPVPDKIVVYKKIDGIELKLHFFFPENHLMDDSKPAIVFYHGGGWNGGAPSHFYNQSEYSASRGMVAVSVQYRTKKANDTSPIECLKDAKSAMRWVRSHASDLGINPNNIVASGGSAGGHLAAALATVEGFNEEGEDVSVSCIPQALVLFNPVANNSEEGYGYNRVKDYWEEFSPYHNIKKGTAPTLIMLGTKDKLFKVDQAEQYKLKMEQNSSRCDLILYQDQDHAFFNIGQNREMHFKTMYDADMFLISLGILDGNPNVEEFKKTIEKKK